MKRIIAIVIITIILLCTSPCQSTETAKNNCFIIREFDKAGDVVVSIDME